MVKVVIGYKNLIKGQTVYVAIFIRKTKHNKASTSSSLKNCSAELMEDDHW